ncbi:MAG: hypothetical protein ACM31C_09120 [Acidobacteriota bacterium]
MRCALAVVIALSTSACDDFNGPACNTVADCGDPTCANLVCEDNHCGIMPLPAGAMGTIQTDGDCKLAACDGKGHVVQMADDSDLPAVSGACFVATCTGGTPSTPPAQAGTTCGQDLVCDDVGKCVGCYTAFECPGTDTECHQRTCTNEMCGVTNVSAGTKLVSGQVKGDCQVIECDGSGGTMSVADNTDKPTTTNQCISVGCSNGAPTSTPLPAGTSCGTGLVCDGNGVCGQCNAPSDCPALAGGDTDCQSRTCTSHVCGVFEAAAGTPTSTNPPQIAGDCHQIQCDGSGGTMTVVDDTDPGSDNNSCTADTCSGGNQVHTALADGTVCADPGSVGTRCLMGSCVPSVSLVLVGDGSTALSGAAAQVAIEDRYTDGTLVAETGNPVTLPTAASGGNAACTETGSGGAGAPLEGFLTRSADEHYVLLACYDAAPGTASVLSTASSATNRIVARVDATLAADTTTRLDVAFSGNSVRSATSSDGNLIWVAGSQGSGNTSGGTWYTVHGATGGTQVESTPTTNRCVHIYGGQLYGTSGAPQGYPNVFAIGSGEPVSSGQTVTPLPGMPTGTTATNMPLDYVMLDLDPSVAGLDTLYVADNRTAANGGGIQKWTFDGTSWTLATTFDGLTPGMYALTGFASGAGAVIIAIANTASANVVVMYVDDGVSTPTPTTIATAPANKAYRGVALSPH